MKRYLLILGLLISVALLGCGQRGPKKEILAKVNNYEISKDKFEEEFKDSVYGRLDTLDARREFLDNIIDRKLILQDAQLKGLDKQAGFLRMIEKFWEQSLLKIALDKKVEEISASVSVSDKEVRGLYDKMLREGKTDKSYLQMRNQLIREIAKVKESQAISEWVAQLHKKAQIKINEELLK